MNKYYDKIRNAKIEQDREMSDAKLIEYFFDSIEESDNYILFTGFRFWDGDVRFACGSSNENMREVFNKETEEIEEVYITGIKFIKHEVPEEYALPKKYFFIFGDEK